MFCLHSHSCVCTQFSCAIKRLLLTFQVRSHSVLPPYKVSVGLFSTCVMTAGVSCPDRFHYYDVFMFPNLNVQCYYNLADRNDGQSIKVVTDQNYPLTHKVLYQSKNLVTIQSSMRQILLYKVAFPLKEYSSKGTLKKK